MSALPQDSDLATAPSDYMADPGPPAPPLRLPPVRAVLNNYTLLTRIFSNVIPFDDRDANQAAIAECRKNPNGRFNARSVGGPLMALNRVECPVERGVESILGNQRRYNGASNASCDRVAPAGGFVETANSSARVRTRWMPFDCRSDFCDIGKEAIACNRWCVYRLSGSSVRLSVEVLGIPRSIDPLDRRCTPCWWSLRELPNNFIGDGLMVNINQ